jgi:mannose-6-phosphate isomerase
MDPALPPLLHFAERYYPKIWGGAKLREQFGKDAPSGEGVGEAWLVSDHEGDESVVDEGPLEGHSFRALLERHARAVLGARAELTVHGRFPLLLKIIDAAEPLSVQVHPDDATAARLDEPDVGKTEMWHVLQAEPGSELICGLDPNVSPAQFAQGIRDGSLEEMMVRFEVQEGTSTFVAAGTVHAIGGGILLAEIQQNSDVTYRIYDWGRTQADGASRELHVDKALEACHFGSPHGGPAKPLEVAPGRAIHGACRYFATETVAVGGPWRRETGGQSFHILLAKTGGLSVEAGGASRSLSRGEALLVCGEQTAFTVTGEGELLDFYVPDLEADVTAPLLAAGHAREDIVRLGGDPQHSDLAGCAR